MSYAKITTGNMMIANPRPEELIDRVRKNKHQRDREGALRGVTPGYKDTLPWNDFPVE